MKVKTSKGFTLAELLIVMAIIVVLAAVAIPTFGKQLETSRETGDMEIIRNAYTEALSIAVLDATDGVINGVIGDPAPSTAPATNGTVAWGAVSWAGGGKYKVTLNSTTTTDITMNAKFSQSSTSKAWKYVSGKLMDRIVPEVCTTNAEVYFTFKISDTAGSIGDVVLIPDTNATTAAAITLS